MRTTLSIVTVVRNDVHGLIKTYQSIKKQSSRSVQWVVVDGASTDGTAEWVLANRDEIHKCVSGFDRGIYHAMNKGLALSDGDYILFLNAGDVINSFDTVDRILSVTERYPDVDVLYGDSFEEAPDGRVWKKKARHHNFALYGMFTHHQSIVFRRRTAEEMKYNEKYTIGSDYAFTLTEMARARRIERLPFAVSRVAAPGASGRFASTGRRDQAAIRREVLGTDPVTSSAILAVQWIARFIRDQCPQVYFYLRYGQSEGSAQSFKLRRGHRQTVDTVPVLPTIRQE